MADFRLISAYQDDAQYRLSFHRLTKQIFGFDLEEWYQKGFWGDRYVPYSYLDGEEIIANVSVNKMDLVLEGEKRKAIQIGTVMTHPAYRRKGLCAGLLTHIFEEYDQDYDLFYLFANDSVLDFYPKFGFRQIAESRFWLDINTRANEKNNPARKLDITDPATLKRVCQIAASRRPVSDVFGVEQAENLVMFHALYFYKDFLYYCEAEETVILCEREGHTLYIYDLISAGDFDFQGIVDTIADNTIERIVFHFTPNLLNVTTQCSVTKPEFFVRGNFKLKRSFMSPTTAKA